MRLQRPAVIGDAKGLLRHVTALWLSLQGDRPFVEGEVDGVLLQDGVDQFSGEVGPPHPV